MTKEVDSRPAIVEWAAWGVKNNAHFNYTEGSQRMLLDYGVAPRF